MHKLPLLAALIACLISFPLLNGQTSAAQTAGGLLQQQLSEAGVSDPNHVIKQVDQVVGNSLPALPLHDRIDFSTLPFAKIGVPKLDVPACLVLTPSAVNYVFKGKPDSFQGSFRSYEFHIGEGLNKAARMIYPQAFRQITTAPVLAAADPNGVAIAPEVVDFRFRMGGMLRPSVIASIKIRVDMYQGGRQFFSKIYEVKDVKKSSYTIFPSKKQEHKAISKAIIDALKMHATEIAQQPEVMALQSRPAEPQHTATMLVQQTSQETAGKWEEDMQKYDFDQSTEQWLRDNQHQIARAENQSTRQLLKKTAPKPLPPPGPVAEGPPPAPVVEEDESYYTPLPEAYSFVPTELDRKRWAARKAQIELARAERAAEDQKIERADKLAKIRNNEAYAKRLQDNNWAYNNKVSETIIDHGENIILAGKTAVVAVACLGPQAAVSCAPVTGTMVSYGRFDSLAAGIGEGTAEYQQSGDLTKSLTKGTVAGTLDYATGWAGGKAMRGVGKTAIQQSKAVSDTISDSVRKQAYQKTKLGTKGFVDGAFDSQIKTHIYKANKNSVRAGMKRAIVDGIGVDSGKKLGKWSGIGRAANDNIDNLLPTQPEGRPLGEEF